MNRSDSTSEEHDLNDLPTLATFFNTLHPQKEMDDLISASPRWSERHYDPPDGSETTLPNADRCPIDYLSFKIDQPIESEDLTRLIELGWKIEHKAIEKPSRPGKKPPRAIEWTLFRNPGKTGAVVKAFPNYTNVSFCPGRVLFGRNDRIASISQGQLSMAIQAHTLRLLAATTRAALARLKSQPLQKKGRRNRSFLMWSIQSIDLCVQAKIDAGPIVDNNQHAHPMDRLFRVYRMATTQRTRELPVHWNGKTRTGSFLSTTPSGLTWGVPAARDDDTANQPEAIAFDDNDEPKGGRKTQGRVSITLYDKGRDQNDKWHVCPTNGKPLPIGHFARLEVRYRGIDGCASILRSLKPCASNETYLLSCLFRRQKDTCKDNATRNHIVWLDLDYRQLHRHLQLEVLELNKSCLRATKIKGKPMLRRHSEADFHKLSEQQKTRIAQAAKGGVIPGNEKARRAAMAAALSQDPTANLYEVLWPKKSQRIGPKRYLRHLYDSKPSRRLSKCPPKERVERAREELRQVRSPAMRSKTPRHTRKAR